MEIRLIIDRFLRIIGYIKEKKWPVKCDVFIGHGEGGEMRVLGKTYIHPSVKIDASGNIEIGNSVIISEEAILYTHGHHVHTKENLIEFQKKKGVKISPLKIGNDVSIGARAIVLEQVTEIPDGVVVGAGAILT